MRLRAFSVALFATLLLGGALVAPASADEPSPKSAPVLRFLDYNICGSNDEPEADTPCGPDRDGVKSRVDVLKGLVADWDADMVFLQEVCRSQYDELMKVLGPQGYGGSFAVMITPQQDPDPSADLCKAQGERPYDVEGVFGNAVIAKGPVTELPAIELNVGGESPNQTWRSACLEAPLQGRRTRACSVHLNSFSIAIQTAQATKLAGAVGPWIDADVPVVLGGDFNAQHKVNGVVDHSRTPQAASLDAFYGHSGGSGRFIEADETDAAHFSPECRAQTPAPLRCRSGEYTVLKPKVPVESKYDSVFLSEKHFKNVVGDALPRKAMSDHYPYRAAATWSYCQNEPDGKADLLRRSADGSLYRHFGGHSIMKLHALSCKVGAAWNADWNAMRRIARAGDVDGDGSDDLYTIDTTGSLRLHPGHYGSETFFRWPRTLTAAGAWTGTVNMMTVSPDMNGDGRRDLVVRTSNGLLTRLPVLADGDIGPGVPLPAPAGGGAWSDYNKIVAAGDLTGNGTPDFLARTPAGELYLYETAPGDTFTPRVRIGWSWNQYDDFIAPGDVDGDGKTDVLARHTNGDMWFYGGLGSLNGTVLFADRMKSGYGYPAGETLF